jgi:hypothetical protein
MEKIKWSEKITNEEIVECTREKKMLLNNIFIEKPIVLEHILRRNHLHHDTIKNKSEEVGRRRTQILDDLRNKRRFWEPKKKTEDRTR